MYDFYLFDLDGTLTKSELGIYNCIKYALDWAGIPYPDAATMRKFIGPPLNFSFKEFCGVDEDMSMKLVHKYRERYNVTGLFENEVYDGIYDTLKALKAQGAHLAVATAKPQIPTEQILERFELDEYFDSVIGSLPDGSRLDKKDIIALALTELTEKTGINVVTGDASNAVMIGDRFYDIKGGQACGIHTMGVLYGYGSREELIEAGADYTPDLPKDILRCYNA